MNQGGIDQRILRLEEWVRRLRNQPGNANFVTDLTEYLYIYNSTPGPTYEGWTSYAGAGFQIVDGRCFLTGLLQWLGGSSHNGSRGAHGSLSINSTALPEEARPPTQTTVELPYDIVTTTWNPAPLGGTDGYYGASIQVVVTTSGFIQQPTAFGNAYSGRARKASDSSIYTEAAPDGSVLILEGASWVVA